MIGTGVNAKNVVLSEMSNTNGMVMFVVIVAKYNHTTTIGPRIVKSAVIAMLRENMLILGNQVDASFVVKKEVVELPVVDTISGGTPSLCLSFN